MVVQPLVVGKANLQKGGDAYGHFVRRINSVRNIHSGAVNLHRKTKVTHR